MKFHDLTLPTLDGSLEDKDSILVQRQVWRRLGHIYVAAGEAPALLSHASYPTAVSLDNEHVRVFFSPRDALGRSSIFSLNLAIYDGKWERLGAPVGPWLEPGPRGAFDDSGASVSCIQLRPDGGLDCWYLGWNLGVTVPFRTAIGLATSGTDEERFTRVSQAPVIDRSPDDPFLIGYPWALKSGDDFHVWYGTHLFWGATGLEMEHGVRRAVSRDRRSWLRDRRLAVPPRGCGEFAVSRPCVLRDPDGWRMWYCRRYNEYRLGFATSSDGLAWSRADDLLEFVGPELTWEGGVRTYPCVFDHCGNRFILYNGVGYGRTGFGLAILVNDD